MPEKNHRISTEKATKLTERFRNHRTKQSGCWWFGSGAIKELIGQQGCEGVRIYLGMTDDGVTTPVVVATDGNSRDLTEGIVLEQAEPCPPHCDEKSPLRGQDK